MMKLSNVLTRTIVAFVAIPVLLAITYYGRYAFLGLVLIITILAQLEFGKITKAKSMELNFYVDIPISIAIILSFYYNRLDLIPTILFVNLILITIFEMFRRRNNSILNCSGSFFTPIFFGFFYGSLVGIREIFGDYNSVNYDKGFYLVATILATIWICDSAAYFGGITLGKHRLFERISPKKSWEGAIFGFVFAIITVVIAKYWILNFLSWTDILFIGIIVGIIGQIGDLIESMFKRNANLKDSSSLIPGHGGVYDRFDSLLYVSPFIYFYFIHFYH